MENTERVLFEDDSQQWFVAVSEDWVGPLTATEVYQKILARELSWAHYVWRSGQSSWQRVCDVDTFQAAVPAQPGKAVMTEVREAARPAIRTVEPSLARGTRTVSKGITNPSARRGPAPPPAPDPESAAARIWFLYYNDSQFGPFSGEEIRRFIHTGRIHARVHVWCEGMSNWERLEKLVEFKQDVKAGVSRSAAGGSSARPKASRIEQRRAPRKPLVAKIRIPSQDSVIVGVCRDISVGGMQVLTDRVPGSVGSHIRLNVSPPESSGKTKTDLSRQVDPFVAEGEIVRILEDGRGFSFRFEKISPAARKAIEKYIEQSA